nr:N-formylglutamate amidohydrolase [Cognatishimia sp. F0-27]
MDPDPVFCQPGDSGIVLTVEHAGRAVPARLAGLGLPEDELARHIGWDPGAFDLARAMAPGLKATVVAQRYSRLVIDCNRPWGAPDLMPEISDATVIPGNAGLSDADRKARWEAIHTPFHAAVDQACAKGATALVALHSYDPQRRGDGALRPWPVGLLWRKANPLAEHLAESLGRVEWLAPLGINLPYEIEEDGDYTIPVHAEARGLPHVLIEVRNDYLQDAAAVERMAAVLSEAISKGSY